MDEDSSICWGNTLKICLLSSSHRPDDDRIFFKEARSLARRYHEVELLVPYPEYLPADTDGVAIHPFQRSKGLLGRVGAVRHLYIDGLQQRADLYHCHEPESLLAAILIKRKLGVPVVFDSHELWEGVLAARFPRIVGAVVLHAYRVIERWLVKRCDGGIAATEPIANHLIETLGRNRVETLLNVPSTEVFGEGSIRQWGEQTVICHDGYLTFDRGLKTLAEAVRLVAAMHAVVFRIIGDVFGDERKWLDRFVAQHQLEDTIVRTGWLPYSEVGMAIAPCHIGLVGFSKSPNHVAAAPNKIFNYLMYGIPIIGPAFMLSLQEMAAKDKTCVLVDAASPKAYADAICQMIENREKTEEMSRNALVVSREKYRWEHMERKLLDLYERVLNKSNGKARAHAS